MTETPSDARDFLGAGGKSRAIIHSHVHGVRNNHHWLELKHRNRLVEYLG